MTALSERLLVADTSEHSRKNYAGPMDCGICYLNLSCYVKHLAGSSRASTVYEYVCKLHCVGVYYGACHCHVSDVCCCVECFDSVSCQCTDNDHWGLYSRCHVE